MNIIIVVAKRDRKRHEGVIARFNAEKRYDAGHGRPDHVLIAEFGQGLQGYRADMIIMLDYPKDERDVLWFDTALRTRLVPGGIFLDMN